MSRLKRNILFIQSSLEARINTLGHKHRCYLCNNTFNHFDSYQGGSESRSPFIKNLKITNEKGFIKANESMETSMEGLFAAGDVISKSLRQVATAVGDGALAAYSSQEYIESIK